MSKKIIIGSVFTVVAGALALLVVSQTNKEDVKKAKRELKKIKNKKVKDLKKTSKKVRKQIDTASKEISKQIDASKKNLKTKR